MGFQEDTWSTFRVIHTCLSIFLSWDMWDRHIKELKAGNAFKAIG